jgi:hypothetical protein
MGESVQADLVFSVPPPDQDARLLQARCEGCGADYAVFWRLQEGGTSLVWGGGYISAERKAALASQGAISTYADGCRESALGSVGSRPVARCFTTGETIVVHDVASSELLDQARKDLAAEYGVVHLTFTPALGGVIEYAMTPRVVTCSSPHASAGASEHSALQRWQVAPGSAADAQENTCGEDNTVPGQVHILDKGLEASASRNDSCRKLATSSPRRLNAVARALKKELSLLRGAFKEFEASTCLFQKRAGSASTRKEYKPGSSSGDVSAWSSQLLFLPSCHDTSH